MDTKLTQSIVKTLAYFDLFRYPLTREELFRFLFAAPRISYDAFVRELHSDSPSQKNLWEEQNGYFFLPGRQNLIAERQMSQWHGKEKMRIALRAARLARYVPFLEAFFVCNQLPVGIKEGSDIDIFVVTTPNRIWFVRFFLSLIMTLFGLRQSRFTTLVQRHSRISNQDNICLSFYVSSDNINFRSIALSDEDIYLQYWCAQLVPLYDPNNIQASIQEKNKWVVDQLGQAFTTYSLRSQLKVSGSFLSQLIQTVGEFFFKGSVGDRCNRQLSFWQKRTLQKKGFVPDGVGIIMNESILKFHEHDRRGQYLADWRKRYTEVLGSVSEL